LASLYLYICMIDADLLKSKLSKGLLPTRTLFRQAKLLNLYEESAEYHDSRYYPFYYYLGTQICPKRVLQIGMQAGLIAHCFLQSCQTVEQWNYYDCDSSFGSVVEMNTAIYLHRDFGLVRRIPELKPHDCFDLIIISVPEDYFKVAWEHLNPQGLLIADYIKTDKIKIALDRFTDKAIIVDTRYGTAIIER
jgi:hypothetical protein